MAGKWLLSMELVDVSDDVSHEASQISCMIAHRYDVSTNLYHALE